VSGWGEEGEVTTSSSGEVTISPSRLPWLFFKWKNKYTGYKRT
jgi:hypothetical protein